MGRPQVISRSFRRWLPLLLALAGGCREQDGWVSGRIEARRVVVSAEMPGRLVALHVGEGSGVEAGQLLAELDCVRPEAQLAQARAQVETARAQRALVGAGAREQELALARADLEIAQQQLEMGRRGATREQEEQIEAALAAVEAQLALARRSLERAESLREAGSAPGSRADEAQAQVDGYQAERDRLDAQLSEARRGARREERRILEERVAQAEERVALLEAGARPEELAAADAQVELATAAVTLAEEAVARCRVTSPTAGVVEIVDYEPGELVTQGAALIAITQSGALRVRTYAPQDRIPNLDVGSVLTVVVDGQPEHPLEGRVTWISDEAEFTAGNVQTPEDRMLLVFRVDLELSNGGGATVRPGMGVTVDFDAIGEGSR